ncbi:cellulose biosynthesis cyclic di-GMP-binding regulatory protein BcsB, partial [Pseudoalteromonas sp. SG44-5]|uniref:cellulose biosynthesis cyclic di-GMP-binding regulatory protein BcsB n=1 Tax=Pseudoalteromonas sp. SG44-5 TaxID=2760960 RepID=UPI0021759B02
MFISLCTGCVCTAGAAVTCCGDFLRDYPDVDKPTIEIISNPLHRYKKMLLIVGKDTADLKTA